MSEAIVWASDVMVSFTATMPMRNILEAEPYHPLIGETKRRNEAGEVLAADNFPKEVWGISKRFNDDKPLPDIFMGYGPWIVSKAVVNVMLQLDIGSARFYHIRVLKKDRTTAMPGEWLCLNFGNVKKAYIGGGRDPTPHIKTPEISHTTPFPLKDNILMVSADALAGSDIWVDSQIYNTFFVSNRLALALKAAGVAKAFGFKRCKVV